MGGCMDGWVNGWVNGRMHGWVVSEWMDELFLWSIMIISPPSWEI